MTDCSLNSSPEFSTGAMERAGFVAINTIHCTQEYAERFECLFCSRAKAIEEMDGFLGMQVLKATKEDEPYLVVSYWQSEQQFQAWVGSEQFHRGHARAFEDLKRYKEEGKEPPMHSKFMTYGILTN